MADITLPPLPMPQELELLHRGINVLHITGYCADQLRARDLEVARVVLEAAADRITGRGYGSYEFAQAIRAIEVSHE